MAFQRRLDTPTRRRFINGHGTPCPYGSHTCVRPGVGQFPIGSGEGTAQQPLTRVPASTVIVLLGKQKNDHTPDRAEKAVMQSVSHLARDGFRVGAQRSRRMTFPGYCPKKAG